MWPLHPLDEVIANATVVTMLMISADDGEAAIGQRNARKGALHGQKHLLRYP